MTSTGTYGFGSRLNEFTVSTRANRSLRIALVFVLSLAVLAVMAGCATESTKFDASAIDPAKKATLRAIIRPKVNGQAIVLDVRDRQLGAHKADAQIFEQVGFIRNSHFTTQGIRQSSTCRHMYIDLTKGVCREFTLGWIVFTDLTGGTYQPRTVEESATTTYTFNTRTSALSMLGTRLANRHVLVVSSGVPGQDQVWNKTTILDGSLEERDLGGPPEYQYPILAAPDFTWNLNSE